MIRRPVAVAAAAAVLLACASGPRSGRSKVAERAFTLPEGQGALVLPAPADWTLEAEQVEDGPIGVRVTPQDGAFVAVLTPYWDPEAPGTAADARTAQTAAEMARRDARDGSVEKEIALEELVGEGGVHGYWFAATDQALAGKEPGEDEWRAQLKGAAAVGGLVLTFEVLDQGPGPHRAAMLELVRRARHEAGPGAAAAPPGGRPGAAPKGGGAAPFEPDPSIDTVPLEVELPGRRWVALVDLPGFAAAAARAAHDGRSVLVLAQHPENGMVASVLLVAADAAEPAACRTRDLEGIRRAVPDLEDLRLSESPGMARAEYVAPTLGKEPISQWNLHGWRARDGVCVHLHLSKMGHDGADHAAAEAVLETLRFGEAL